MIDDTLFFMLIVGIIISAGLLLIFVWAAKSGQFDDLSGPGFRILMDDDLPKTTEALQAKEEDHSTALTKKEQP